MDHHRLRAFQRWRNAEVRRTSQAGIVANEGSCEAEGATLDRGSRLLTEGQHRTNSRLKYLRLQHENWPDAALRRSQTDLRRSTGISRRRPERKPRHETSRAEGHRTCFANNSMKY